MPFRGHFSEKCDKISVICLFLSILAAVLIHKVVTCIWKQRNRVNHQLKFKNTINVAITGIR